MIKKAKEATKKVAIKSKTKPKGVRSTPVATDKVKTLPIEMKTPETRRIIMNPSTEQMEKMTQGLAKACEEMNAMAREHAEAAAKSVAAATKGWDEITRSTNGLMQESFARTVTVGKTLMTTKNMNDMANLQAEFFRDFFDGWMASTGKITEISVRVTKEMMDPLAQHANDAFSKIMQKARAA